MLFFSFPKSELGLNNFHGSPSSLHQAHLIRLDLHQYAMVFKIHYDELVHSTLFMGYHAKDGTSGTTRS